jgi:eukaryotic-like serine/threonine-protein kinase
LHFLHAEQGLLAKPGIHGSVMVRAPISLGPFQLVRALGTGGMGVVWEAVHGRQGVAVAIKVLHPETPGADLGLFREAIENEVRAAAGLDHPNSITVFDYGTIPPEIAELSSGELEADSPWFAMELVEGGTLLSRLGRLPWEDVERIARALLSVLAHAHARGVIHRDVKPGNVLLTSACEPKLADFGLAAATGAAIAAESDSITGTPAYMAPEQLQETAHLHGPWTDLYALGCVLYGLVSGAPPFPTKDADETIRGHLFAPVPKLVQRCEVPEGFEDWLATLLEKSPRQRFQRAADAAWAFDVIAKGPRLAPARPPRPQPSVAEKTLVLDRDRTTGSRPPSTEGAAPDLRHVTEASRVLRDVPTFTDAWRSAAPRSSLAPSAALVDVGLGLYGLRSIPLVDRTDQREALWHELGRVHHGASLAVAVLEGPMGCGKSRLAEWLCQRAHELGLATPLVVSHGPTSGPSDGLAGMLVRQFRCHGPDAARILREQLEDLGVDDPDEREAIAQLALHSEDKPRRIEGAQGRYAILARILDRLCQERPVVLWIDDAQWALDALEFVQYLVRRKRAPRERRILVVMTARSDALVERPTVREAYEATASNAQRIWVGPLEAQDRRALVQELLSLEPKLAAEVAERTQGNPLFAVQLVGDWVENGLLETSPEGFRLRGAGHHELPGDLYEVWAQRIDKLLERRPAEHGLALELAAVSGEHVDHDEWVTLCGLAGFDAPIRLAEALVRRRLATAWSGGIREGWSFVHGMLRESVLRRVRESGRWRVHHERAAEMLVDREDPLGLERRGRHLLEAGHAEVAAGLLLRAATAYGDAQDFRQAALVLALWMRALVEVGVPEDHPLWGLGYVQRIRVAMMERDNDEADRWTARIRAMGDRPSWAEVSAEALVYEARRYRLRGRGDEGPYIARALEAARAIDNPRILALAHREAGERHIAVGELDDARRELHAARALLESFGEDVASIAATFVREANVTRQMGDLQGSLALLEAGAPYLERDGSSFLRATALIERGEIARSQGDLDVAQKVYEEAWRNLAALELKDAHYAEFNLGLVALARGDAERARKAFEDVRPHADELEEGLFSIVLACASAATAAALGEWDDVRDSAKSARALFDATGAFDIDCAELMEQAARTAEGAGHRGVAKDARELATEMWLALGRSDRADPAARPKGRTRRRDGDDG